MGPRWKSISLVLVALPCPGSFVSVPFRFLCAVRPQASSEHSHHQDILPTLLKLSNTALNLYKIKQLPLPGVVRFGHSEEQQFVHELLCWKERGKQFRRSRSHSWGAATTAGCFSYTRWRRPPKVSTVRSAGLRTADRRLSSLRNQHSSTSHRHDCRWCLL